MKRLPEILISVPQSKADIDAIAITVLDEVDEGNVNPLELECALKQTIKVIEKIRENENYNKALDAELGKYNDKKFTFDRYFVNKSSRTNYDYKGDYLWKELDLKKKTRETFLKSLKEPMFDNEGIQVSPPIITKTDYITVEPIE